MTRLPIHAAWLLLAIPFVQACAAMAASAPVAARQLPRLLTASPDSKMGGETRSEGQLQIQGDCVLVISDNRAALPIFDASVSMTESGNAIMDSRNGKRVSLPGSVFTLRRAICGRMAKGLLMSESGWRD